MENKKRKFKAFCAENGLTAQKIADDCGLSKMTIYSYYRGVRSPNKKTMKILKDKYGLEYDIFID